MADDITNQAFANAAQRTNDQKAALLQVVANAGQAGLASYTAAQGQTDQLRQNAVNGALQAAQSSPLVQGNNGGSATVTNPLQAQGDLAQQNLANGSEAFGQAAQLNAQANANYMNQLGAAIPIVQARTQAAIQKILAQQQMADQDRQLQRDQLQAQIAASKQGNGYAAQAAADAHQKALNDQFCFENPTDPRCASTPSASALLAQQKYQDQLTQQAQQDSIDSAQRVLGGSTTQGFQAFVALARDGYTLEEAQAKFKTPGGKPLNWDLIQRLVDAYNSAGQPPAIDDTTSASVDSSGGS